MRASSVEIQHTRAVNLAVPPPSYGDKGLLGTGSVSGAAYTNDIEYITISVESNGTDFGDLTKARSGGCACSNGSGGDRAVFCAGLTTLGGFPPNAQYMDYVTISTPGNATEFGEIYAAPGRANGMRLPAGCSNGSGNRGVISGGNNYLNSFNYIDYITISSIGNSQNFGDLINKNYKHCGLSNHTGNRGIFAGGGYDTAEYLNLLTGGNAVGFGNLQPEDRTDCMAMSNSTNNRGIIAGGDDTPTGNTIDYITITSASNSTNFGDLTESCSEGGGMSNGVGNRGVFGGGYTNAGAIKGDYEYIAINSLGDATTFGSLNVGKRSTTGTDNGAQ